MKDRSTTLLGGLATLFMISSAQAAVLLVDTGFANTSTTGTGTAGLSKVAGTGSPTAGFIYTHAYNAGASFSTLVVTVSREAGTTPGFSVSYGGVGMNLATGGTSGSGVSIFYLNTTATTGNIVVDFSGFATVNGVGIGIAAIKSDNGDPLGLNDANSSGNGTSITVNTADDSFTMFGIDTNLGAFSGLNTSPLTQIFANTDVGSNGAGAAYELVTIGQTGDTYSYTNTVSPRGIAAANFVVVPEPNAAALIGGFGVLVLLRRRR